MSALTSFLRQIDPSRTIDDIEKRANRAINSFDPDRGAASNIDKFQDCLCRFYVHLEHTLLGIRGNINRNTEMTRAHVCGELSELYGPSGHAIAFNIANTGVEEGLYGILKQLAMRVARKEIKNRIGVLVTEFLDQLSPGNMVRAEAEYLEKYGHLLPADALLADGSISVAGFREILMNHPYLLKHMRDVGRS